MRLPKIVVQAGLLCALVLGHLLLWHDKRAERIRARGGEGLTTEKLA